MHLARARVRAVVEEGGAHQNVGVDSEVLKNSMQCVLGKYVGTV